MPLRPTDRPRRLPARPSQRSPEPHEVRTGRRGPLDSCTLRNVWWEDVGEDAASFLGSSSPHVCTVTGGGAKEAGDKVFQVNGADTLNVSDFAVRNFGTFVRSCGNCKTQDKRTINLNTVEATYKGSRLVGINTNLRRQRDPEGDHERRRHRQEDRPVPEVHREQHGRGADHVRQRPGRHPLHVLVVRHHPQVTE
ncbi:hypothetical protein GCM10010389_44830 [Streptomyces echinoruber]|uniref:Pectate lyase n=1 Tax=Streptomyces echinoruber TaxID=68898 RepID=A0A918RMB0_9ACTN|nr:hypothetical protein GCM10010389_44830 [Streptomyces echinoruber]